jgi:hypothetical protein
MKKIILSLVIIVFFFWSVKALWNNPYNINLSNWLIVKLDAIVNKIELKRDWLSEEWFESLILGLNDKFNALKSRYNGNLEIINIIDYLVFELENILTIDSNPNITAVNTLDSSSLANRASNSSILVWDADYWETCESWLKRNNISVSSYSLDLYYWEGSNDNTIKDNWCAYEVWDSRNSNYRCSSAISDYVDNFNKEHPARPIVSCDNWSYKATTLINNSILEPRKKEIIWEADYWETCEDWVNRNDISASSYSLKLNYWAGSDNNTIKDKWCAYKVWDSRNSSYRCTSAISDYVDNFNKEHPAKPVISCDNWNYKAETLINYQTLIARKKEIIWEANYWETCEDWVKRNDISASSFSLKLNYWEGSDNNKIKDKWCAYEVWDSRNSSYRCTSAISDYVDNFNKEHPARPVVSCNNSFYKATTLINHEVLTLEKANTITKSPVGVEQTEPSEPTVKTCVSYINGLSAWTSYSCVAPASCIWYKPALSWVTAKIDFIYYNDSSCTDLVKGYGLTTSKIPQKIHWTAINCSGSVCQDWTCKYHSPWKYIKVKQWAAWQYRCSYTYKK